MKLVQVVTPSNTSVTLAEMKVFLRVISDDDNDLITSMITQAEQSAELVMNRQIMPARYELYFDNTQDEITLPRPPFRSLISLESYDGESWNEVTDYELDDKILPAKIFVNSWGATSSMKNSVKVVFESGWEDNSKVPEAIKAWIKIQVSTYYEHREAFVLGTTVSELPPSHVDSLIERYRIIPI